MRLSDLWQMFSPRDAGARPAEREDSPPRPSELEAKPSILPIAPVTVLTERDHQQRLILGAVGLALVLYAYFINKTCELNAVPCSLARWLWAAWGRGPDDAHGYFVPLVTGGLLFWTWKRKLRDVSLQTAQGGLAVVVFSVLLYWMGVKAANPRVVAGSLVVLIFGLIFYLAGWRWARELWFPCAFLMFMIPLTFLDQYSFYLRMFVARISTGVLNGLGMQVLQNGTAIASAVTPPRFEPLDVAAPCSGIHSLVALMALTSVYGFLTMDKGWKQWLLFASSIPLAVVGNLARIVTITFVAQGFGQEAATRLYHDYSGYLVFSLATVCMVGLGALLNLHYRDWIDYWMQDEVTVSPHPPSPRH